MSGFPLLWLNIRLPCSRFRHFCDQESEGSPKFSDASLHAYHALRWTPADPREAHQNASSVLASGALKPSPSALSRLRGCIKLWGVRSPLRSTWFPVYASTVSFGSCASSTVATLGTSGWLDLTLAGTSTPQEAPSFAWRTNGSRLSCPASHCCGAGGNLGKFLCRFQKERVSRVSFSRWPLLLYARSY